MNSDKNIDKYVDKTTEKIHKKRGRKPKGGKIVKNDNKDINIIIEKKNIILHLKCKLSDLQNDIFNNITSYNPNVCNVEPYQEDTSYEVINSTIDSEQITFDETEKKNNKNNDKQKKEIYDKLSELEKNLNTNNINKKSACFWCTYDFETPQIYIPKLYYKESYNVYGCFCSPECACSYLFNEHIDNNTKHERYQLLNYIYGKIYNYKKNIKLAPNPYYTLNKYMGNLDIEEYRQLLTYEKILFVIDKPLTKIYPELHEDNNDFETMYEHKIVLKKMNKIDKSKVIKNVFNN
jgi:hypothetical protein